MIDPRKLDDRLCGSPDTQVTMPIELAKTAALFIAVSPALAGVLSAVLNRRRRQRRNRTLSAAAKPASTSIAPTPQPLSP